MPKMSDSANKSLLCDIFGIFPMPQLLETNPQDQPLKALDELPNGRLVTGQASFGELPVVHYESPFQSRYPQQKGKVSIAIVRNGGFRIRCTI